MQQQLRVAARLSRDLAIVHGMDSVGRSFPTIIDAWCHKFGVAVTEGRTAEGLPVHCEPKFGPAVPPEGAAPVDIASITTEKAYRRTIAYWEDEATAPATVDGMLGEYGFVSKDDLSESLGFLEAIQEMRPELNFGSAVDCGGGIGRVVKGLLGPLCDTVDLVEQSERLLASSAEYVASSKLVNRYHVGIQDFRPEPNTYDIVWLQWVIGYLTDHDLVEALQRFAASLKPGGVIVIKDNVMAASAFWIDDSDGYVIRSREYLGKVFEYSGLVVLAKAPQVKWPEDAYDVDMHAFDHSEQARGQIPSHCQDANPKQGDVMQTPLTSYFSSAKRPRVDKAPLEPAKPAPPPPVVLDARRAIAAADAVLEGRRPHLLPHHFEYLLSLFSGLDTRLRIRSGSGSRSGSGGAAQSLDALRPVLERLTHRTFLESHLSQLLGIYPGCFKVGLQRIGGGDAGMPGLAAGPWAVVVSLPTPPLAGVPLNEFRKRAEAVVAAAHTRWCETNGIDLEGDEEMAARVRAGFWHPGFPLEDVVPPVADLPKLPAPAPAAPILGRSLLPPAPVIPTAPKDYPGLSRLKGLSQDLINRVVARDMEVKAAQAPEAVARRQATKEKDLLSQVVPVLKAFFAIHKRRAMPYDDVVRNVYHSLPAGTFSELGDVRKCLTLLQQASGGWFVAKVLTLTRAHVASLNDAIDGLACIAAHFATGEKA